MGSTGGWNRPAANQPTVKKSGAKASAMRKGLSVCALIVAVCGAVCYFISSDSDNAPKEKSDKGRGRIKEVAPAVLRGKSPETMFREAVANSESTDSKKKDKAVGTQPRHALSVIRGSRKRVEEALKKGIRPLFAHESDSFLAMYCQPGVEVPPPPINEDLKMDFVTSLFDPIVAEEGDTPDQIALKEMVASMRADLKTFISEGGTFEEYFRMLANRQETEVAIRNDAFDSYQKMIDDNEDGEIAAAYWKKMNHYHPIAA